MKRIVLLLACVVMCGLIFSCGGKSPAPGEKAVLDFTYEETVDGLVVSGTTNLPDGTKVGISITDDLGDYITLEDVIVESGRFKSQPTLFKGFLFIGKYVIEVYTYFNDRWQKEDKLELLNSLTGDLIKIDSISNKKSIRISKGCTLGTPEMIKEKAELREKAINNLKIIESQILQKLEELENMYLSNDQYNFELKISKWNREISDWQSRATNMVKDDVGKYIEIRIKIAINNVKLVGTSYSMIYQLGRERIDIYLGQIESNLKEMNEKLKEIEKI